MSYKTISRYLLWGKSLVSVICTAANTGVADKNQNVVLLIAVQGRTKGEMKIEDGILKSLLVHAFQ